MRRTVRCLARKVRQLDLLHAGQRGTENIARRRAADGVAGKKVRRHPRGHRVVGAKRQVRRPVRDPAKLRRHEIQPVETGIGNQGQRMVQRHRIGDSGAAGD